MRHKGSKKDPKNREQHRLAKLPIMSVPADEIDDYLAGLNPVEKDVLLNDIIKMVIYGPSKMPKV